MRISIKKYADTLMRQAVIASSGAFTIAICCAVLRLSRASFSRVIMASGRSSSLMGMVRGRSSAKDKCTLQGDPNLEFGVSDLGNLTKGEKAVRRG